MIIENKKAINAIVKNLSGQEKGWIRGDRYYWNGWFYFWAISRADFRHRRHIKELRFLTDPEIKAAAREAWDAIVAAA